MIDGARDAQRQAFVQHLIVPRSLVVGVEQDVRVAFDQAGQQRGAGQIDDLGVGGVDGRGGSGGLDAVAAHAHGPAFVHGLAVEDAGGLEDGDVLRAAQRARRKRTRGRIEEL